ncbi:MAG: LPXTG cell wall anchor domain-containing protein [Actinobacteria bacterium]|nr:LPXTG cell wall anchor domain-containing protein [Actinomycetota bacterium]MSZ84513.1 LPXTG cell wall anchor domain-containing protein [Actinomycetota bacterium]MTB19811.1 LPXTG cell wall anchor domain-containing protein [Actinomycetota bacterium]
MLTLPLRKVSGYAHTHCNARGAEMNQSDGSTHSRFKMGLISMAAGSALVIGGLWIVPAHAEGGSDQGSCNSEQTPNEGDNSDCSSCDSQQPEGEGDNSGADNSDCSSCDSQQPEGEGDNSGADNSDCSSCDSEGTSSESDDESSDCSDSEETTTTVEETTTTVAETTTTVAETTTSVASEGPAPTTSVDQQSEAVLPSTGSNSTSLLVAFGGLLLGLGLVVAAAGRRNAAH